MKIFKKKYILLEAAGRPLREHKSCKFCLHNIIAWYNRYVKSETSHENSLPFLIGDTSRYTGFIGSFNFNGFTIEPRFDFILSLDQKNAENQLVRGEDHWKHETVRLCETPLMPISFMTPECSRIFKASRILSGTLKDQHSIATYFFQKWPILEVKNGYI